MSNPLRITKGEAVAGAIIANDDVTTGDDLIVGDDASVAGDLAVTGASTTGTLAVGSGGTVVKTIKSGTGAIDLAEIAAGETGSGTITITGAAAGDALIVNVPALTTGLGFAGSNITGANTATLYFVNASSGAINQASATFNYTWIDLT